MRVSGYRTQRLIRGLTAGAVTALFGLGLVSTPLGMNSSVHSGWIGFSKCVPRNPRHPT